MDFENNEEKNTEINKDEEIKKLHEEQKKTQPQIKKAEQTRRRPERRKKKKKNGLSKLILLILVVAVVISVRNVLSEYGGINIKEEIEIEIPDGYGTSKIADLLEQNDIIKYPLVFKKAAQMSGYDKKMRSGTFVFTDGMSYKDIMVMLSSKGEGVAVKVTIPEGYEISQIAKKLEQAEVVTENEFYEALDFEYDYRFLEDIGERELKLEGYLFPDTYNFKKGESAENVIKAMLDNFDKHFKDEYYDRAAELDMTVDEIVTLASIIERETNRPDERKKVAGVFYNRLEDRMRLQSCATVQYALKERKAVLSLEDTKIESPYNTYINYGLPIGPIASPGASCIEAALYPEETDALYFVLDSAGNHVFSKTHEEHVEAKKNAAVKVE